MKLTHVCRCITVRYGAIEFLRLEQDVRATQYAFVMAKSDLLKYI